MVNWNNNEAIPPAHQPGGSPIRKGKPMPEQKSFIVRLSYDADSVQATIHETETEDQLPVGTVGWIFVREHGSWDEATSACMRQARQKIEELRSFGPPPENTDILVN